MIVVVNLPVIVVMSGLLAWLFVLRQAQMITAVALAEEKSSW